MGTNMIDTVIRAAKNGDLPRLRRIKKESLLVTDANGWSPLHHAAAHGQSTTLRWLCQQELPLNQQTTLGMTPLMVACRNAATDACIKILLTAGADIHIKDNDNANALHHAILSDNIRSIKPLVERGIELNLLRHGLSPLQLAVELMRPDIAEYLVTHGADVEPLKITDPEDYTRYKPLQEARLLKEKLARTDCGAGPTMGL